MPVGFTSMPPFLDSAGGTKEHPEWRLDLASHNARAEMNGTAAVANQVSLD
jgi:hypothetical protein